MPVKMFVLLLAAVAAGCSGNDNAPTPPPPPPPACQVNNTADVSFQNTSRATTHTIFWDGLNVATVAPGQTSARMTTAAGVAHRLETRIANTTLLACAPSQPVPIQCGDKRLYLRLSLDNGRRIVYTLVRYGRSVVPQPAAA